MDEGTERTAGRMNSLTVFLGTSAEVIRRQPCARREEPRSTGRSMTLFSRGTRCADGSPPLLGRVPFEQFGEAFLRLSIAVEGIDSYR